MSETIINGIIEESQDLHGSLQYQKGDKGDDGVGISDISKTSTVGKVDTYTITLTDGTTKTFTVTNGDDGTNGISVSTVSINESGHLIVTLSDGTNVDAGIAKSDKTDQTFDPLSKNPQSGIAVAEAIKNERLIYHVELTEDTDEIKVTKDMDGKPFSLKSVKIFAQVIVSEGLTGYLIVCVRTDGGGRYLDYHNFDILANDGGCRFYSESNYDQYTGITSTTAFAMKKTISAQGINGSTVKHTIADNKYVPITDIGFFTKAGNNIPTTLKSGTKITIMGVDV